MNFLSKKKNTAIFIFFPWKKAAGASLATVTEALAGLQIRDTLKSTAHSIGCLFLFIQHQTPSPSSFTAASFQLPDALKSFVSAFLHRFTQISFSRPAPPLSQLTLTWEMEFAAGSPASLSMFLPHSCCRKSSCHGFIGMCFNYNAK